MQPARNRILSPYICSRCIRSQQRHNARRNYSGAPVELSKSPPYPPRSGRTHLTNRRLIALHGPDAPGLLHSLTTATVRPNPLIPTGFYASFLTATGRVLNDVFIYPVTHSSTYRYSVPDISTKRYGADCPAYIVECDAGEVDALAKHFRRYKLRAKLDLRTLDDKEWQVWSLWEEGEPWTPHTAPSSATAAPLASSGEEKDTRIDSDEIGCVDARAPGMGRRLVIKIDESNIAPMKHLQQTPLESYTLRRYLRGIPEGQQEIHPGSSLPQESNIDYMGGIDFRKGCYMGQELTIRTHHTGVVRKRILPCMIYRSGESTPQSLQYDPDCHLFQGTSVVSPESGFVPAHKKGRPAGKWISGIGNIGLGLCRIEMMTDMVLTAEGTKWTRDDEFKIKQDASVENAMAADLAGSEEVLVKAFVPDWVRNKTKVQKPQLRV